MGYRGTAGHQYEVLTTEELISGHKARLRELESNLFVLETEQSEYLACALIASPDELPEVNKALGEVSRRIQFGMARLRAVLEHPIPLANPDESSEL